MASFKSFSVRALGSPITLSVVPTCRCIEPKVSKLSTRYREDENDGHFWGVDVPTDLLAICKTISSPQTKDS